MGYAETIASVIETWGENVTFTTGQTETYNEDTGWSTSGGAEVTVKVIPYNYLKNSITAQDFGELSEGEIALVCKGTTTVNAGDKFVYSTKNYEVTRNEPLPLQGTNLATIVIGREKN